MGFFSYKCAISNMCIPAFPYAEMPREASEVVQVLPDDTVICGAYDGYGKIVGPDGSENDIFQVLEKFICPHTTKDEFMKIDDIYFNEQKIGKIKKFFWDKPIKQSELIEIEKEFENEIVGKTKNTLVGEGYRFASWLELFEGQMKIVRKDKYTGQKFAEMKPSDRDEEQGFFISKETKEAIVNSLKGADEDECELYNHAFSIGFSLISRSKGENVTGDEMVGGILCRVADLLEIRAKNGAKGCEMDECVAMQLRSIGEIYRNAERPDNLFERCEIVEAVGMPWDTYCEIDK